MAPRRNVGNFDTKLMTNVEANFTGGNERQIIEVQKQSMIEDVLEVDQYVRNEKPVPLSRFITEGFGISYLIH